MTVDLGALQAAAANGKAGLVAYQQQRDADTASKDAALQLLIGHGYGSSVANQAAGITSAIGQTHGRNLARLGDQERGATARQATLASVPHYIQYQDALEAKVGPWQSAQQAADANMRLQQQGITEAATAKFKADEAAKQQGFDKEMWNKRFRLAHPGTTIV